jgi:uncharacterized membrane protein
MAGIGWRLERMLDRDSLSGAMGAFLTGVAVTSGPWLLTTLVLVLMRISAMESGLALVGDAERIITVVYAVVIVLSAPIDIVLSRFAADRVYDKRRDQIAAPLRRALATGLIAFTAVGAGAMLVLRPPLEMAIPGAILATVVGGQWLLLSAAGGLSSPGIILRAFALGAPVSVIAALALSRPEVLGAVGYLYGFGSGQVVTLGLLLWGTLRALPAAEDDSASLLPAFREYWLLALTAFAFHAGLWVDKLVILLVHGGPAVSIYAAAAALAWLSVVPACAFLFVRVETVFADRFNAFYAGLHDGASLGELERLSGELRREVGRTLRGTAAVQAGVTLIGLPLVPLVVAQLSLGAGYDRTLALLLLGAGPQVLGLAATLLLYYFDFRAEALVGALVQLVASAGLTLAVAHADGPTGAGYAVACTLACATAIILLHRRMAGLLVRTFQEQPYSSEV